jgi:flagellar motor switch protein FliN/FliY
VNPSTDLDVRLVASATAAVGVLWSPVPLEPSDPVPSSTAAGIVPAGSAAFVATFSGSSHGTAVLIVDAEMVAALQDSSIGSLSLTDAARGVLEAAAGASGPIALGTVLEADPVALLGQYPDLVVFPLTGSGSVRALVGLELAQQPASRPAPSGANTRPSYDLLLDVEMDVTAELGRARMTVRNLLDLEPGTIVELDRMAGSPVDLLVNGRLIARGEVVVVDEEFALRVTEIVAAAVEADH